MKNKISRRSFLKGGLTAAGTIAAAGIPATVKADDSRHLATLIDISKCEGCEECVEACREAGTHKHPKPEKPFPKMYPDRVPVEDWSDKQDVTDRLTPYNRMYIQNATVNHKGDEIEINIPRRCMHCVNPPCVKLCPFGAARQLKNGISRLDPDFCLGGGKCRSVCPWKIPQRQTGTGIYRDILPSLAGNGVMYKCDRCYDRLAEGELPACIEACPEEVQTIGPRDKIIKQAYALAKKINGYVYGDRENGGTNTIYVSPVPFEKLDTNIEKGKGRPHLKTVKNTMADTNTLASAMVIAPVAGLAAAVGKYYKMIKSDDQGKANESN